MCTNFEEWAKNTPIEYLEPRSTAEKWKLQHKGDDIMFIISNIGDIYSVRIEIDKYQSETNRHPNDVYIEDEKLCMPFFGKQIQIEPNKNSISYEFDNLSGITEKV